MKYSISKYHFSCYLFLLFFAASCSKTDKELSELNELITIDIPKSANSLSENALIHKFQNDFYITLPIGAGVTNVITEFKVSEKATVKIKGAALENNKGSVNFTDPLTLEVVAENGNSRTYNLLAHEGKPQIDKLLYSFLTKFNIPGASLAISNGNHEVLYKNGFGYAVVEDKKTVKPNHLFRLGSVSKQFTALCIMKLVDEGVITIDSKVFGNEGILKEEFPNVTERASKVTIRHLLSHTTGWTSDPDPMFSSPYINNTIDQNISYILTTSQKEPGTSFSYYNMGYGIAGKVIEKLTGKDFETYLKEVLLQTGIEDIHVGGNRAQRRANEVVYYSQNGYNGYNNNMKMIAAAGGIIASTEQMLKLLPYIDGNTNVPDILSKPVRDLWFTKMVQSGTVVYYTLGWRGGHQLYPDAFYHTGNLAGTAAMWVIGKDINCILLMNGRSYMDGFDNDMYYLLSGIINTAKNLNW